MHNKEIPILLKPVFFNHLWGGTILRDQFNKDYTQDNVGESWEVSSHPNGNSTIASGKYKGMKFGEYYKNILGNKQEYPLLIKLIGPKKDLSVQVHPNDGYAQIHENSLGKKEAWYVLSAPKSSKLIAGINCSKGEFKQAVKNKSVMKTLKYLDCKKGDVIAIDPGMVHALLKDVIIYEVQQNSDITYRIYDWDRVDAQTKSTRQLHVAKALDVIEFDKKTQMIESDNSKYQILTDNEYFTLIKINIDGEYIDKEHTSGAYTLIEGNAEIVMDGKLIFKVSKGDSFYAPISNNFTILGKGELLKSVEKWF